MIGQFLKVLLNAYSHLKQGCGQGVSVVGWCFWTQP